MEPSRTPTVPEQLDYLIDRVGKLEQQIIVVDAKIEPIHIWMKDLDTGKKFVLGFGSFAGAMIAIGAVIIWVGNYLKVHFS